LRADFIFKQYELIFISMENIWQKLKAECKRPIRPITVLAPMAGITDSPFRQICRNLGADVVYSEMASVAALCHDSTPTFEMLKFTPSERPYIVQLFGRDPLQFATAAQIVAEEIKPDGLDINLGCPVPKVFKQGAGAALMADFKNAHEAIKAVIDNTSLPVSIKVRTAVKGIGLLEFLDQISDLQIAAIMVHGRTYEQGFGGTIDYATIKKVRDHFGGIIIANGGIYNYHDAENMLKLTQADGVGIAQGALGNPWIFEEIRNQESGIRGKEEVKHTILAHLNLILEYKGERGIVEMRKHLCWYVRGLAGAKRLREKFVKVENEQDIREILDEM
jgi:tRNA-dihydrouridine synthase B